MQDYLVDRSGFKDSRGGGFTLRFNKGSRLRLRLRRASKDSSEKLFLKDTDILIADAEVTDVFTDMNIRKVVPVHKEIISLEEAFSCSNQRFHDAC